MIMADKEPESLSDSLNDVYCLFPNNGSRQKLRWIVNRLIRLTKSNSQTITSILEQSQTINAQLLCNMIEATWTTDYNFQTAEEVKIDDRGGEASASVDICQLLQAVDSILPKETIENEVCLAMPNQPPSTTKSKEAEELDNKEKSDLDVGAQSTKTKDLNLSNNDQRETYTMITAPVKETTEKVESDSSSTSSSSCSSDSQGYDTPVGGTSDLSENESKSSSSESEDEEDLKSKAVQSVGVCSREKITVNNKKKTKADLCNILRNPYSPPRKQLNAFSCVSEFKCTLCKKVYPTARTLEQHQKYVHNILQKGYFCRKNCRMWFKIYQSRKKHEKTCKVTSI